MKRNKGIQKIRKVSIGTEKKKPTDVFDWQLKGLENPVLKRTRSTIFPHSIIPRECGVEMGLLFHSSEHKSIIILKISQIPGVRSSERETPVGTEERSRIKQLRFYMMIQKGNRIVTHLTEG